MRACAQLPLGAAARHASPAAARRPPARATAAPLRHVRALAAPTPAPPSEQPSSPPPPAAAAAAEPAPAPPSLPDAASLAFGALWLALVGYALFYAPNQTPMRDSVFLAKLVGLDGGEPPPAVLFCLFNAMGVWPAVYAALLTPSGRCAPGRGPPAWPFVAASFAVGAFALLPYFALWAPPPGGGGGADEDGGREARGSALGRALESRAAAALLLLVPSLLAAKAATSGGAAWAEFGKLFQESRFVHVTCVDFVTLSLCAPFWVYNDAERRGVRSPLLPALAALPLLGPALYLNLRPRYGRDTAAPDGE